VEELNGAHNLVTGAVNSSPLEKLRTLAGRIDWPYASSLVFYHLVALLAFWPWLFSWTGLAAAHAGQYVFGTLGISLCYHRLLTHRSFGCPKWLERFLAILGVCCLQDWNLERNLLFVWITSFYVDLSASVG
jgi:fatty-acid desaturase